MTQCGSHKGKPVITVMQERDISFAISLTDREGWGFYRKDFETRLYLYPNGAFVARYLGRPVGIISSVQYGQFAFLGNLIVRSEYRGQGIGSHLMQHAIDYLLQQGVSTIELDGVLSAVSIYRRLGFKDKYLSLRLARQPIGTVETISERKAPASAIPALDHKLTGIPRQKLLRSALADDSNHLYTSGSPLSAYALVRERAGEFCMIAPLVASGWRQVPPLMEQILACHSHRQLWFGVPEQQHRMSQLLIANGFEYTEPSLRMYFGNRIDYEKHVYGIFGPAVG